MIPMITGLSGLSGLSGLVAGGPVPPPLSSDWLAYYEASKGFGTTVEYAQFSPWEDQASTHDLSQATAGDRPRLRKGSNPLVYNEPKLADLTFTQGTISIDRRASSFFCLAENDRNFITATAEHKVLMSLPSGVGDLLVDCASAGTHATLVWKDASGTYDTGIETVSSLALYGVILGAAGIKIVMNDLTYDIGTPLPAGTTTGFDFFKGSYAGGQDRFIGGVQVAVWYDHAVDAGELTDIQEWAVARKAIFASDASVTKHIIATGDSLAAGLYAEGNLCLGRQYAQSATKLYYHNMAFGGLLAATIGNQTHTILGTNNNPVGTGLQNHLRRQAVALIIGSNDLAGADSSATIITNILAYRETLKAYGYQLVYICIPPRGDLTGPQETKRLAVNAGMTGIDERRYGKTIAVPAELTNSGDLTYYDADTIHLTKAANDLFLRDAQTALDAYMDVPVTTLQTHVKFNGTYVDESGYERDFAAINSPTFISGLWGRQALRCALTGNHAARQQVVFRNLDYLPLTVMIWAKTTVTGNFAYFVSKESDAGGSNTWQIAKKWDETIICNPTGLAAGMTASGAFNDGVWRCMAMVLDSTGGKLYVSTDEYPANLTLRDSQAWATVPVTPSTGTGRGHLRVGSYSDTGCYNSDVQDLHLWFESKTLAQLQAVTVEGMS